MTLEQDTKLRNGKLIDSPSGENTPAHSIMAESNTTDSDSNDNSDISSQWTERKETYEREINELESEFGQLKDLMKAIISKPNEDGPSSISQGASKQPRGRLDINVE